MPDINWGGDSSTAPFSSRLDEANGGLILAEDNSGGTVLLEYDGSTWQYRGPVELNGNDISGVGALTATDATVSGTVDADTVSTDNISDIKTPKDGADLHPLVGFDTAILLRPGAEYVISEPITEADGIDNCRIIDLGTNQGGRTSTSKVTYTGDTSRYVFELDDGSDPKIGFSLGGFELDCNGAAGGVKAFYFVNSSRLNGLRITNVSGEGVWISNAYYSYINGVECRNVGTGFRIDGSDGPVTDFSMQNPIAHTTTNAGYDIDGEVALYSPLAENTGGNGFNLSGNVYCANPYTEAIGGSKGINATGPNINIDGGNLQGGSGMSSLFVDTGVSGSVSDVQCRIAGSSDRPDYHIENNSSNVTVKDVYSNSYANTADLLSDGLVIAPNMTGGVTANAGYITNSGVEMDSVDTKQLGNGRHFAGAYAGADPDSRLDAAISAASVGDKIFLEKGEYTADRTISKQIELEGVVSNFGNSTFINSATWTFTDVVTVTRVGCGGPGNVTFDVQSDGCGFSQIDQNTLTIDFASGTQGSIVDEIRGSSGSSATINDPGGNNVIGNVF